LYSKTLEQLGERSTPEFWSEAELKDYLNRGQREFYKQSRYKTILASLTAAESGRYFLPQKCLEIQRVYFNRKPLEKRSVEFLESDVSGTAHFKGLHGDGKTFGSDFRAATAETPDAWYYEDGRVCLFPIPTAFAVASARSKFETTLAAGSTAISTVTTVAHPMQNIKDNGTLAAGLLVINTAIDLPTNKDFMVLVIGGVYQNKTEFNVSGTRQITLNSALPVAVAWEVFAPIYGALSTQSGIISAGNIDVVGTGLPSNSDFVLLFLNGLYQNEGSWNYVSSTILRLTSTVVIDTPFEIVIIPGFQPDSITSQTDLPLDQNLVDLFLDGVYQNKSTWTITNKNLISLTDGASPVAVSVEIVFFASQAVASSTRTNKERFALKAGSKTIFVSRGYVMGINALSIRADGVALAPSSFIEVDPYTSRLVSAFSVDVVIELSILTPTTSLNVEARHTFAPGVMADSTDLPEIVQEDLHDAIWSWACWEALSREGRGKDMEKAQKHIMRFGSILRDFMMQFGNDLAIQSPEMPFFV